MTGIVLWNTNEAIASTPIQLEYSYFTYAKVVAEKGEYNWSSLDRLLDQVAGRGHQAIIRFHDTYVGAKTGVPKYITELAGYETTKAKSEGKDTEFPDWSHPELRRFAMEFFDRFSERYDRDPRIAFVQVGFGLWSEYHIYDGPMTLGKTFPSKEFQAEFMTHLSKTLVQTPWMISVDAADDSRTPFAGNANLLKIPFGLFDDSINHKAHGKENGYRFRINAFESGDKRSRVEIENVGVAPIYYDAFVAVNGVRSPDSLKGFLPGVKKTLTIESGDAQPKLSIECDRLVKGQRIEFEADLK